MSKDILYTEAKTLCAEILRELSKDEPELDDVQNRLDKLTTCIHKLASTEDITEGVTKVSSKTRDRTGQICLDLRGTPPYITDDRIYLVKEHRRDNILTLLNLKGFETIDKEDNLHFLKDYSLEAEIVKNKLYINNVRTSFELGFTGYTALRDHSTLTFYFKRTVKT